MTATTGKANGKGLAQVPPAPRPDLAQNGDFQSPPACWGAPRPTGKGPCPRLLLALRSE
jgi:hypothetical protein